MGFAPPPRGGFAFVAAAGRAHARTVLSRSGRPHPPNELSLHRMANLLELRRTEVRFRRIYLPKLSKKSRGSVSSVGIAGMKRRNRPRLPRFGGF